MPLLHWAISQLISYSVVSWLVFIAIAFIAASFGRVSRIILGHVVVAVIIAILDVRWIQAEMHRPDWNGVPDQDVVFMIGVAIRVVLINTVLLPISAIGLLVSRRLRVRSPLSTT